MTDIAPAKASSGWRLGPFGAPIAGWAGARRAGATRGARAVDLWPPFYKLLDSEATGKTKTQMILKGAFHA